MIRRPPRSTLFPYTRSSDLPRSRPRRQRSRLRFRIPRRRHRRSEEHTSELQSRSDLVCRLLLEKKKVLRTAARTVAAAHPRRDTVAYTTYAEAPPPYSRTRR